MVSVEGELLSTESIGIGPDGLACNGETNYQSSEVVLLRLGHICVFPQTREFENPVQDELQNSIAKNKLINDVDVVRLDKPMLHKYADFVLRLWGKNTDIASMSQSTYEQGKYDVLVAGYSRYNAIKTLENEKAKIAMDKRQVYNPDMALVPAKIYSVGSTIDMLAIQLNENIHSAPAQERVAMALVETYYLGLEEKLWHNRSEFQRLNSRRFNANQLNSAWAFAQLPEPVRDLVFAKIMPYGVGVGLGNLSATMYSYYEHHYFEGRKRDSLNEDECFELDNTVNSMLMLSATRVIKSNLNVSAARMRFESDRKRMLAEISGNHPQPTLDDLFEQAAMASIRRERRQHKAQISRLLDGMLGDASAKLFLAQSLIGKYVDKDSTYMNMFIQATERISKLAIESAQQ